MRSLALHNIDRNAINTLLERVLSEMGTERFSGMRLLELERVVRASDPTHSLPGKTVLRDAINKFRAERWPATAPKKMIRRW
jgi:hypothetical protein